MFWLIEFSNPFEPHTLNKTECASGCSILEIVVQINPKTKEFAYPTICILNGKPMLRATWQETILKDKDVISFIAVTGSEIVLAIIAVVLAVVSIAVALLMPVPKVNSDSTDSDPVYSLDGSGNQMRLSLPIEVNYGLNRIYPSYAARPYYEYQDNNQYQFSLLCIGQGVYDIAAVQIGDSPIANYTEASYEIIPPGEPVTLFPTNVYTSPEAGGQTLLGPNDPDYPVDTGGWTGPFVACPSGAKVITIEIDITLPQGLYSMSSSGSVGHYSISFEAQYRPIDDAGNPTGDGSFSELLTETLNMATVTPQRKTYSVPTDVGRYEVRMRRTTNSSTNAQIGNVLTWEGMRGWVDTTTNWGNVTLLAVKIQATNNLNNQTQQLINVIATRKLPIRNQITGVWSDPVATRSLVWAYVDLFRATYGGRITDDIFYDWDTLYALDTTYTTRGDHFDWTFRDADTVWDGATSIAQAGRGIPLITGSLISLKRDAAQTVPEALFNQENIIQGSFTWGIKLWGADEYDSLNVTYIEPASGYVAETLLCVLPGDSGDNPDTLQLIGVMDRTQAYHEGLYRLACNRYLRETFSFQTGLEGYIPTYGSLIGVSHDVPKWGQGGFVVNAEKDGNGGYQLWVSEPLKWTQGATHQIWLRAKNGSTLGTFVALQTQDEKQLSIGVVAGSPIDFQLDGLTEPMLFLFGPVGSEMKMVKVTSIEPQGQEAITISGVNNSEIPYSFDSVEAPSLENDFYVPIEPDLPIVDSVSIAQVTLSQTTVNISWPSAFGAKQYIVQTSYDNTNWTTQATTDQTSLLINALPGILYVRVAGINTGQGPYALNELGVGTIPGLVVTTDWTDIEWGISWFDVLSGEGYQVRVYDNTNPTSPVLKNTSNPAEADPRAFNYDYTQAVTDGNLVRKMLVQVDVKLDDNGTPTLTGNPASMAFTNSIPLPPTALTAVFSVMDSLGAHYTLGWTVPDEADLIRVKVWLSTDPDFDAATLTATYDYTAGSPGRTGIPTTYAALLDLDSNGHHPAYYFKVAVFDVWGNEVAANLSVIHEIPGDS